VELQELLGECAKRKASDLHLKAGSRPILRIHGHLEAQDDLEPISHDSIAVPPPAATASVSHAEAESSPFRKR
jgi:Tfp pilus assembly pilus retraction ATPase PilT